MSLSPEHRQTFVVLVICILVVGAAAYAAYGDTLFGVKPVESPQSSIVTSQDSPLPASNDWKNQFLTAGSSTIAISRPSETTPASIEPETLTGQFGKKFFEQYMYLKQNNLSEDPQAIQALVDQTTNDLVDAAPQARIYDIREILISTKNDSASVRAYANTIGSIFSANMPAHDAATVALQALEEEDKSRIKEVESIAASYNTMLKAALSVPSPSTMTAFHVNLVNALSAMSFASKGMTHVFDDPIQSIAALGVYENSLGQFRNAMLDLKFSFSQQGMEFTSNEPAIIFSLVK